MILFNCPRCQQRYTMPDLQAGNKFACVGCGQRIQVPSPPREPDKPRSAGRPLLFHSTWLLGVCSLLLVGGVVLAVLSWNKKEDPTSDGRDLILKTDLKYADIKSAAPATPTKLAEKA